MCRECLWELQTLPGREINMKMMEEHKACVDKKRQQVLYRIGMFAAINHVTIKTLRYYDEQGLLKPGYVDEANGYRYYLPGQIADIHQIQSLRNMGFSIDEIREILNGKEGKDLLKGRKQDVLSEIANLTARRVQIESYLAEEEVDLKTPVLVKMLPEVTVASVKTRIERYDNLFDAMPEMGKEMERLGCVCAQPGYCFTHYPEYGYRDEDILVELCEAVTQKMEDTDKLTFHVFPEIKEAACIFHKGPYNMLPVTYEKVLRYIEENNYDLNP